MPRQAISVTLDSENLTWLRGRVGAGSGRSVSDLLDRLVTAARTSGRIGPARSVVGTIDIADADPMLDSADAAVQALFEQSLERPVVVRERPGRYGARKRTVKRHA
jgi:ATP-dependent DNA ligase